MIGATMWHGPHQVAQKSTTASPLCCSTSTWKVASVTADGCFTSSITLHAPSIHVSLTCYERVRRSHRHRGHEHHRRPCLLSRRSGTLARTPGYQLIDDTPRLGAGGRRIAFLHPKTTSGILLELTE